MKKHILLRTVVVLFVAVLFSTGAMFGTLAKYVGDFTLSDSSTEKVRIAAFGAKIAIDGSLFGNDSKTENGTTANVAESVDILIRPGSKNTEGLTLSFSGTSEVTVEVVLSFIGTQDVYLGAGTLPDTTTADTEDTFVLSAAYYPIVYTLTQTKNGVKNVIASGNLNVIQTEMEAFSRANRVGIGTDLADEFGTLTLTWEWPVREFDVTSTDFQKDTLLGDLAAGKATVSDVAYSTAVSFNLTVSVVQVD